MNQDDVLVVLLLSGLVLHPVLVWQRRTGAALLLFVVVVLLAGGSRGGIRESYKERQDKMDFFPWNEARIVRKRTRESTVVDCGWALDQKGDNIFYMDDPVVREYAP